jgi:MFS family permease
VFYALFGIPLGKLADRWTRTRLLAIGLAVWSAMTALSGLSRNFTQLGLARIGVGVGEASAGPSAYSLLSDYFRRGARRRDRDLFAGIYLGGGVSLFIGSSIANGWNSGFAPGAHPFGLAGWQVAFLAVGLPGLLLAGWVNSLREPAQPLRSAGAPPRVAGRVPVQGVRTLARSCRPSR